MANITGKVFNIQRFSTEDGPGVRTTVFLKGCPLRCLWCSNPESQSLDQQVAHRNSLCISCGRCLKVCPEDAISMSPNNGENEIGIDRKKCKSCGECINVCATGAMSSFGQTMTVDDVLNEIKKDMDYYANSNGGITVSGGEPLVQADFVAEIFRRCRNIGIHTTLDTCGVFDSSALNKVLDFVNLVLFDIKVMDRQRHIQYTGIDNDIIIRNARLIAQENIKMIIRIPIIPGKNDSENDMNDAAQFIAELGNKPQVNLLPYHNYGENKYKMLGMKYQLPDTKRPSDEHLLWCQSVFRKYDLDCAVC